MVFPIRNEDLPHVAALGAAVVEWGHLEGNVGGLLFTLHGFADSDDDREKFYATFGHLDLRTRIAICKTRGLLWSKLLPEDWYKSLTDVLNYIENDLRPNRNRYVHDIWLLQGRSKKINYKPQVKRPQAGNFVLEFGVPEVVTAEEIFLFCEKVRKARSTLQILGGMTRNEDDYEPLREHVTQFLLDVAQSRQRPKEPTA